MSYSEIYRILNNARYTNKLTIYKNKTKSIEFLKISNFGIRMYNITLNLLSVGTDT